MQQTAARDCLSASLPIPSEPPESYYRARYYDPAAGRFLSEDQIAFKGGINFYRYVRNDSPTLRDPSGKLAIGAVIGAVSGAVYGAIGAKEQCGSTQDIIIAAVTGALIGGVIGAADPTEGALTEAALSDSLVVGAILGGAGGFAADVGGQVIGDLSNGTSDVNVGSALGAGLGGAIGGAGGVVVGAVGKAAGLSELGVTAGSSSVAGGIGVSFATAGGALTGTNKCACQK